MRLTVLLIVLCISWGAYAGKGLPASPSKNIMSRLQENPIVGKLVRGAGYGVLGFAFCVNMMSCGLHGYVGENIYFYSREQGKDYPGFTNVSTGVVERKLPEGGKYLVRLETGETTTIGKDEIVGVYAPSEEELKLEGYPVVVSPKAFLGSESYANAYFAQKKSLGDGAKYGHGVLLYYYNNGFARIEVTHITTSEGSMVELENPFRFYINKDKKFKKGGFILGDVY